MRIHCTTTFLDGVDRFEAGDTRTVDDARGQRFIAQGWAREAGAAPAPAAQPQPDTTLDIHGTQAGVGDSNG